MARIEGSFQPQFGAIGCTGVARVLPAALASALVCAALSGLGGCAKSGVTSTSSGAPVGPGTNADGSCPLGVAFAGAAGSGAGPFLGGATQPPETTGTPVQADSPPPPISGGTLLSMGDGKTLVAADPDRDQVYVIDVLKSSVLATIALNQGDEPGRAIADAVGHVHVALRGGGAIASIDVAAGKLLSRTSVCDLPRGIAYDAKADVLHVACAEGRLVTLSATTLKQQRSVTLERDLRDVVMGPQGPVVSIFRSAQLLQLDSTGKVIARQKPAPMPTTDTGDCGNPVAGMFSATVAWRTMVTPDGNVAVIHQRAKVGEIKTTPGGYSGGGCGTGIVESVVSYMDKPNSAFPALSSVTLPVDMAFSPDGQQVAVAAPGNYGTLGQVNVFATGLLMSSRVDPGASNPTPGTQPGVSMNIGMGEPCAVANEGVEPPGQVTALTYVSPSLLAVQTREPAALHLFQLSGASAGGQPVGAPIVLSSVSRADTGHTMFHSRAGAGVACASCHAEAGDDSHVWNFQNIGPRRTQHLRGGILGTEPFHWNGDMTNFDMLMTEVFVGRMSGPQPQPGQGAALSHWIDRQPSLRAKPTDSAAVARGQALFVSADVGCASCHSGALMTDNRTTDVGTGAMLQVPSLHGVSFRAPFMHNGCAQTLTERFGSCGGGDMHGHTSALSTKQIGDLVSYLDTL